MQKHNNNSQLIAHQYFSGPIPPPEILEKYQKLSPTIVEKIISMAEEQSKHRREIEHKNLDGHIQHQERRDKEANRGQIYAFVIALAAILGGLYAAIKGASSAGIIITAIGVGSIVTRFIYGRTKDHK